MVVMSVETESKSKKTTMNEVLEFVRTHKEPVVTASEVADEFDMTNAAANYRLKQLKRDDKVVEKTAGSSAKVWYPTEFKRSD